MARSGLQEESLPTKLNLGVWATFLKMAREHWHYLFIAIAAALLTSFIDASILPLFFAGAIDTADKLPSMGITEFSAVVLHVKFVFAIEFDLGIVPFLSVMIGSILVRCVLIYANFYFANIFSMKVVGVLRKEGFKRIQTLSFSYFDKNASGWLIARLQGDTSTIGDNLSMNLSHIFWALGQLIFAFISVFSVNVTYALVLMATLPIVGILSPFFERLILVRHRIARNAHSHFVGYVAETIEGTKTIKSLSLEKQASQEAREINEDIRVKRLRAFRINAFFNPLLTLISALATALIVFLSINTNLPSQFYITPAVTILFITYVSFVYQPLESFAETFSELMAAQAGAEKVMQLLSAEPEIVDPEEIVAIYGDELHPKAEAYKPFEGVIDFESLSFHYSNGIEVIHPLNLHIRKGESLAIVGETGSGKTTIANLICRFYEPTGGVIKIDGKPYQEYGLPYLHSQIGYVQQTPFLFPGTIAENLRYGKENATLEELIEACQRVGIHDFIDSLPDKYETLLQQNGGSLSQGQKQLLSFARALLKDPAILILDEATSSIDGASEAELQKGIEALMRNRTSIAIAHRLSTIVGSDRILYLEKGSVLEEGSHEELMAKKGKYYELYQSQFAQLTIDEQMLLSTTSNEE